MPINPARASNIIYGARVSNLSSLPRLKDVVPGIIDPDDLRYIDTFRSAGSLVGTQTEQGTPPLTWTGATTIEGNVAGEGARITAATNSTGSGIWIPAGADGSVLAYVEIGEAAGSVGVLFRCASMSTGGDHWRAIINATSGQASLQCRGTTSRTLNATPTVPFKVGGRYRVMVTFNGSSVVANIGGTIITMSDATQYQAVSGSGLYILNSAAPSQHKVHACYFGVP